MINKYQVAKTKLGPLNFAVSGFGDDGVITGEAYIPQIDVKLECYQEKVPEISNDEPSIIIYSGTQDEMNYDRGFFIGSKTLKPGKLRRNREGKYTFEEFEDLEPGQITELYVTADGDILIAGKPGVAYSEVKFTGLTSTSLKENRLPEFTNVSSSWNTLTELKDAIGQTDWSFYSKNIRRKGIIASVQGLQDEFIQGLIHKELLICDFTCAESEFVLEVTVACHHKDSFTPGATMTNSVTKTTSNANFGYQLHKETIGVIAAIVMSPDQFDTYDWSFESKPVITLRLNDKNTPRWR